MAVIDLDDDSFAPQLAGAERAIVDFYAGWCGPCIMFGPKFKRISNDYPHVTFFKVDGETAPQARKTVTIDELPYFGIYENGTFIEGRSLSDEGAFRAFVESHFGKEAS